jgi:thiamine-monophosphate kinase
MAAMGARPRWATLALTVPAAEPDWLEAFAAGLYDLAERFDVSLIGGDTTRGPLSVTLQIMGTLETEAALTRAGGRAGDDVYVTGTLGDAAAALAAVDDAAGSVPAELWARFAYPEPRVAAGLSLVSIATAAIDISDGLVADLGHICERSGCGAEIELDALPLSAALLGLRAGAAAHRLAATGGDDYELCFTAPPSAAAAVKAAAAASATQMQRIGGLTAEPGVRCRLYGERLELEDAGYAHFQRP